MSYDKEINKHGNILNNSKFKILKAFIAHGKTSTFKHSINVVKCGLGIIDKFNLKVNRDEFIKSALLHDLYFYDWHKTPKGKGLHGFTHAKDAAENAKKIFNINDNEYSNILSHMWPLNITKIPKTKEGVIICIADKICSIKETLRIVNN